MALGDLHGVRDVSADVQRLVFLCVAEEQFLGVGVEGGGLVTHRTFVISPIVDLCLFHQRAQQGVTFRWHGSAELGRHVNGAQVREEVQGVGVRCSAPVVLLSARLPLAILELESTREVQHGGSTLVGR